MKILFISALLWQSILFSYPLTLSSGQTNSFKILELANIKGLDIGTTINKNTAITTPVASPNAILVVANQEKPTQRITIHLTGLKTSPGATKTPTGNVKVLLDSVTFIGVEGSYNIEETGKNQFADQATPTPAPGAPEKMASGAARAKAIAK